MKKVATSLVCFLLAFHLLIAKNHEFIELKASCISLNAIQLEFSVPSEHNTLAYIVSYSFDALNWISIDTIFSNQSNSLSSTYTNIYDLFDSIPTYIKLCIIDYDWKNTYSELIAIDCSELGNDNVAYFTIFDNKVHISSNVLFDMDVYFNIYDVNLNLLHESHINFKKGSNYVIIDFLLEEFKSYVFLCKNEYMLKCHRFVTVSH